MASTACASPERCGVRTHITGSQQHAACMLRNRRVQVAVPSLPVPAVTADPVSVEVPRHAAVPGPAHEHVLGSNIPEESRVEEAAGADPYVVSKWDHPNNYSGGEEGIRVRTARYTLRLVSLDDLIGGFEPSCDRSVHGAHCYRGENYERTGPGAHDVEQPFFADEATKEEVARGPKGYFDGEPFYRDDADFVARLAESADRLPCLLIPAGSTGFNGGGHRTAAWRDAGYTHVPVWVPDNDSSTDGAA